MGGADRHTNAMLRKRSIHWSRAIIIIIIHWNCTFTRPNHHQPFFCEENSLSFFPYDRLIVNCLCVWVAEAEEVADFSGERSGIIVEVFSLPLLFFMMTTTNEGGPFSVKKKSREKKLSWWWWWCVEKFFRLSPTKKRRERNGLKNWIHWFKKKIHNMCVNGRVTFISWERKFIDGFILTHSQWQHSHSNEAKFPPLASLPLTEKIFLPLSSSSSHTHTHSLFIIVYDQCNAQLIYFHIEIMKPFFFMGRATSLAEREQSQIQIILGIIG